MAAELDDAGLVGEARPRARLLEQQRDDRARRARVEERGAAFSSCARSSSASRASRSSSVPVRKWRGRRGKIATCCASSPGTSSTAARCPDVPGPLGGAFAAMLAGWEWDVALLQEVPPWWPPRLARACGAQAFTAPTSRGQLLPARARRRRAPAGHREVVGRRRERDPRARGAQVTAHAPAAAARCARAARDARGVRGRRVVRRTSTRPRTTRRARTGGPRARGARALRPVGGRRAGRHRRRLQHAHAGRSRGSRRAAGTCSTGCSRAGSRVTGRRRCRRGTTRGRGEPLGPRPVIACAHAVSAALARRRRAALDLAGPGAAAQPEARGRRASPARRASRAWAARRPGPRRRSRRGTRARATAAGAAGRARSRGRRGPTTAARSPAGSAARRRACR